VSAVLDTPSSQGSQGDLSAHSADTVWRAALQDIDDLIRTVADPNERVAAVTARCVEWLQADLQAREKTLDVGRFEAFLKSRLPSLRYEVHCACTKDPTEAPIERLLLHFWEELADFLRGSYLTEADRTRLESFLDRVSEERHKRYIELLVDTVRSRLRERARRGGATTSVVAQSGRASWIKTSARWTWRIPTPLGNYW
jgi:hypothetical protein